MVVESFKDGHPDRVGERFAERGRMMSPDIAYLSSWMTVDGARCFQLMEAPNREALDPWINKWSDLVDFEVIPVAESHHFWATYPGG